MNKNLIILFATIFLSCIQTKEKDNGMEQFLKNYATDSLNIQSVIGKDMHYSYGSCKIKNGKLLLHGREKRLRFSDSAPSLIFVIDLNNKKLISTVIDPVKDYVGLVMDMKDDSTILITHTLTKNEIYLIDIFNHNVERHLIKFDETANSPGIVDANYKQLFMTSNVYGFSVSDLDKLEGRVFVNSSFSTLQSTISYPVDKTLNLLSGTFKYDSGSNKNSEESISIYAIDEESRVKWEKALPFIKYDDLDAFNFYNYGSHFIIKYHNAVECLDKENGKLVWNFINEHAITQTFMVGNKLVAHYTSAGNVIPSENEDEMEKIKEDYYLEQFKIIDLENGKVLWSKSLSSTNSEVGIIGGNVIVYNDKNAFTLNLDKMMEQPIKQTMDLNQSSFENIMDTKTGKLFLNYNGTLYW